MSLGYNPTRKEIQLLRFLVFVGGVHGVGKTQFCAQLSLLLNAEHITAGTLIREAVGRLASVEKTVAQPEENQQLLLRALDQLRPAVPRLVLDGHFSLWRPDGTTDPVSIDVFRRIRPHALLLLTDAPAEISKRLSSRDMVYYDPKQLSELQRMEIVHAEAVSDSLGTPLRILGPKDSPHVTAQFLIGLLTTE
jgi:adenylate kinase